MFNALKYFNKQGRYAITGKHNFEVLDIRIGEITEISPATIGNDSGFYVKINFGDNIGILRSVITVSKQYNVNALKDKQVLAIVNFPAEKISDYEVEAFILGFDDGVMARADKIMNAGDRIEIIK